MYIWHIGRFNAIAPAKLRAASIAISSRFGYSLIPNVPQRVTFVFACPTVICDDIANRRQPVCGIWHVFGGKLVPAREFVVCDRFDGHYGQAAVQRPTQRQSKYKQKNVPQGNIFCLFWWPWSDSNRHSLQNLILSQARLPIPPRGQNRAVISPRSLLQPFLPGVHCDLPCVSAFSRVRPVRRSFLRWLS